MNENNNHPTEDLSNLEVGDKVYDLVYGTGRRTKNSSYSSYNYPIYCKFYSGKRCTFTSTGREDNDNDNDHQTLFTYNPFDRMTPPNPLGVVQGDEIEVQYDGGNPWIKRKFIAYQEGIEFPWVLIAEGGKNTFSAKNARLPNQVKEIMFTDGKMAKVKEVKVDGRKLLEVIDDEG